MFETKPDDDSVFTPEPGIGAVGADDEPYDLPDDFDATHETRDLHESDDV